MDAQFKKEFTEILNETLDKKFKEMFIEWFNNGFNDVVLPQIDRLDTGIDKLKSGFGFLENRLETVENRLGVVDRKSDQTLDKIMKFDGDLKDLKKELRIIRVGLESASKKQDVDKKALKGLEKRLEVLEKISVSA